MKYIPDIRPRLAGGGRFVNLVRQAVGRNVFNLVWEKIRADTEDRFTVAGELVADAVVEMGGNAVKRA